MVCYKTDQKLHYQLLQYNNKNQMRILGINHIPLNIRKTIKKSKETKRNVKSKKKELQQ